MFITRKCLPRRTFLRGVGATMALPLLDGMIPALTALGNTPAASVRRLGVIYVPNGMTMQNWTPETEGAAFGLSPILEPLGPFRDRLLVLSGLNQQYGWPQPNEGAGDHARAAATFLTGVHVKKTEGADLQAGISMDQIVAKELGQYTQLSSLEVALDSNEFLGACDAGYSCAYTNTLCWRSPTTPMPMENDPRAVFEHLFGDSGTTERSARLARIEKSRSILDSVRENRAYLETRLDPRDRNKLNEFFDAVRDVERRIQKAEEQSGADLPVVDQPPGVPATFEEHARLMYDLLALAYQCDLTRMFTFMVARELSPRAYPEIGVPDTHHGISHHQNIAEKRTKLAKINTYHMKFFAEFLAKLKSTPDGDGSLLDHSMLLYGAGLSDSNAHFHGDLPIVLVGGTASQFKGSRHLRYPKETPMANLLVTLLDKVGVPMERLGDSTGRIEQLSDV